MVARDAAGARLLFGLLSPWPSWPPCRLGAQTPDSIQASRRRLEEIRAERDRLKAQQQRLQGQVHDEEDELTNLERQRESTTRIVTEIDRQIGGLSSQLDRNTAELILASDNLAERNAVLERRLIDIYKRGQLYAYQVLLTVESFGDLMSRYKYLFLTSQQDRQLVKEVEALRNKISSQRNNVLEVRTQLDHTKEERQAELQRYGDLVTERSKRVQSLKRSAKNTEQQLTQLDKDANRLTTLLANADKRRSDESARAAARGVAPSAGTLTTADLGKLDWPVQGTIVYKFGRDTLPSGGVIRWNGIGIGAPGGHTGEGRRIRDRGTGGPGGHVRPHRRRRARQRLLVPLHAAAERGGETGRQGGARTGCRRSRRRVVGLWAPPAFRDPGRKPDCAGSGDVAEETVRGKR